MNVFNILDLYNFFKNRYIFLIKVNFWENVLDLSMVLGRGSSPLFKTICHCWSFGGGLHSQSVGSLQ